MCKPLTRLMIGVLFVLIIASCSGEKSAEQQKKDPVNEATATESTELVISAAASLTDALTAIADLYQKEHPNIKLTLNFGASGALQQQIEQKAPVDLFLSASKENFDPLVTEGLIDKKHQKDLLGNELVVIVPKDAANDVQTIDDLNSESIKKIAFGTPETTPAGKYAKAALEHYKLWEKLKEKYVLTKDVRQSLTYVETGNVDAGFVFKTDALISDKVTIAFSVDPNSHPPIVYPAGVTSYSKHPEEAKRLYTFLQTDEAQNVFKKYGFNMVD